MAGKIFAYILATSIAACLITSTFAHRLPHARPSYAQDLIPQRNFNAPNPDPCIKVKSSCPNPENQNATLLPNPNDCSSYCACVSGNPVWMPCPEGLHFNPTLHVCDYPKEAGCGGSAPTVAPATESPTPAENITSPAVTTTTAGHHNHGCLKVKPQCPVPEKENATILPNPDDCNSYCVCVMGAPVWMPCPPGLHFNPIQKVCDIPSQAGCGAVPNPPTEQPAISTTSASETTTKGSDSNVTDGCFKVKSKCPVPERVNATLLPNPDDCGSYCECVLGTPILMRCPLGLYFNPSLNVCDYPSNAGCGREPNPPTERPTSDGPNSTENSNVTNGPISTTTEQDLTTNGGGGHADHGCMKVKSQCPVPEGKNVTILPNPDDCGSYCVCVFGTPVQMPCPSGLHFNPSLNVCDHQSQAGCGSAQPPTELPTSTRAPPPEDVTTSETSTTTTTTSKPVKNGCPTMKSQCPATDNGNVTLLPNPDDCESYCVCLLGTPIYMSCPPGLHFNPSLNVCDWPSQAGCGSVPNPPTEQPITSTAPETSTNSSGGYVDPSCLKVQSKCPVPDKVNATLLPNPDDCASFCFCVSGTPILMRCPLGLYFNPSSNVCDIPANAGCGIAPNPPTEMPNTTASHSNENTTTSESTTGGYDDNGCYKVTSQCPVPEKENATLLPNPDDCGSYCACVSGKSVWMPCPTGLHFNPKLHVCDYPKDAGCGTVPVPPSEEPTAKPTELTTSRNDDTTPTSNQGTNGCFQLKSYCPDPEKVNATLLPNPDDCGSYCACTWGIPIWMPCPAGLHFNPSLHVCDYPHRSGCFSDVTTESIPA